jgi:hypothetical protein
LITKSSEPRVYARPDQRTRHEERCRAQHPAKKATSPIQSASAQPRPSGSSIASAMSWGALIKNEQDVHLFERLAFMARREGR